MERGGGKPPSVKSRGKRNELRRSVGSGLQSKFGSLLIRTCGDMPPRFGSCLMVFGFMSDAVDRLLLDAITFGCFESFDNFFLHQIENKFDRNEERKKIK